MPVNLPFGHSSRDAQVTCPSAWPLADRPAQAQPCHGSHSPAWESVRLARPSGRAGLVPTVMASHDEATVIM